MSETLPTPSGESGKHPAETNQQQPRRVFPVRTALDLGLLYILGRLLAVTWPTFGEFAKAFFEGANPLLTTGAILATAWFTKTLWESTDEMRRGNDATLTHLKDSSEQDLRAYVSWYAVEPLFGHDELGRTFTYKNFGRTPALGLEATLDWQVGDIANPNLPPVKHVAESFLGTIMPEQVTPPLNFQFPRHLDTAARVRLKSEGRRVYASGLITYSDVFGKRNRLTFRWEIHGSAFVLTGEGNTAEYGIDD